MLDKAVLKEAKQVYKQVADKRGIVYGVAHARRKNTAEVYNGSEVLEIFEVNLSGYHKSTDDVASSFKPNRRRG